MHLPKSIHLSVCGLALAVALSAGCKFESDRVAYRSGNSFFPLLDGRVLRYEEQRSDGKTSEYTFTMQYAGGQMTKVYPLRIKGADLGECTLLSHDTTVIFTTSDPYVTIQPRATLPEYRQIWVDPSLKPGQSWEDSDTGTKTTFTGYESVSVPAGNFENCYKTLTEARSELFDTLDAWQERGLLKKTDYNREVERAHTVISRWFAPGVGLAKEQVGSEITRTLLKIEKEGAGVADTTKPEKYEIQN